LILKQALFALYLNHVRIRFWDQPVLSNEVKVSCSKIHVGPSLSWFSNLWQV